MSKVSYLPIWKRDATAEERFLELAQMAAAHPEWFARVFVIHQEDLPNGNTNTRYVTNGVKSCEALGMLEMGKAELLRWIYNGE